MTRHSIIALITALSLPPLVAQESLEEEAFEYTVGEVNYLTGEGVNVGGFLFPELFITGTGGIPESGGRVEDFASSEHDPQNDIAIQAIELHLGININDSITGLVAGIGFMGEGEVWAAELEEAFLHFHLNDNLAIGGGQIQNTFGFQGDRHLHAWDFVNQNLVTSRMMNEGALFSQGGEVILKTPNAGLLTFALGGVNSHSHGHDHGHGDDDHDHEEEHHDDHDEHHDDHDEHHDDHDDHDEHEGEHFDYHDAEFKNWVFSADYKFRLPFDDSITLSTSLATGENGFGGDHLIYGVGIQKVWNGTDHGSGPDFCEHALLFRTEFIGREIEAIHEDGDIEKFDDYGLSTLLAYGLSERTTLSLRHDWVSALEELELSDTHRFSPALTTYIDPAQRVRMRLQYDNVQSNAIGSEHIAWVQFQWQWGGEGGSHAHHNH